MSKKLVWLRQDLRVKDNPALHHAAKSGEVICVYIEAKNSVSNIMKQGPK